MAINSRAKRSSAPGVGRPFMRGLLPASLDETQRSSAGNAYPVASLIKRHPGYGVMSIGGDGGTITIHTQSG